MQASLTPVLDARKRARQYWYADGLTQIIFGVAFLVFSLSSLVVDHSRFGFVWDLVLIFGPLAAYLFVLLRHREVVEWFKARITYPRTGYVEYPFAQSEPRLPSLHDSAARQELEESTQRRMTGAVLLCVLLMVGIGVFLSPLMRFIDTATRWLPLAICLALGIIAWLGREKGHLVSWFSVLSFPLAGLLLTIFLPTNLKTKDRLACVIATMGAVTLVEGILNLIRYLRQNPEPTEPSA